MLKYLQIFINSFNHPILKIKYPDKYYVRCYSSRNYTQNGSIYVHWPYCKRRCSYCNFVKFIKKDNASWSFPDEIIEDVMVEELKNVLKESPIKNVTSVFFGGGTPSIGRPKLVEKILKTVSSTCTLASNAEITIEANPTFLEAKKLKDFQGAGVNRVSLGVQSLQDDLLKILNRDHSSREAMVCLEEIKKLYPNKVSVDLIFALPYQTVHKWKKDLDYMLNFCDDHISLYQLTLEEGTLLHKQVKQGSLQLPSSDEEAEMYELALDLLARRGFHQYEVSNFARSFSSESVHNKAVWQGSQYVGIGPGAHSRIVKDLTDNNSRIKCREAVINAPDPKGWLNEVHLKGNGARKIVVQTPLDIQMEYIATSLRTRDGAKQQRWNVFSTYPLKKIYKFINIDNDFLVFNDDGLKATDNGIKVLDALLPRLMIAVEKSFEHATDS